MATDLQRLGIEISRGLYNCLDFCFSLQLAAGCCVRNDRGDHYPAGISQRLKTGFMEVHHVAFAGSYPTESKCPKDDKPEYAFIGRSNVGKSSLINMLTGRKEIAHTSKKPGKTQLLNFFLVDGSWYLVDLPGYGYAKISRQKRREWETMIQNYLVKRHNLQCAFVLIDANVPPQKNDLEFINWLGEMRVPFVIVFTKADRSKPEELKNNSARFQEALYETWEELPKQFSTSSRMGEGRAEILEFIHEVNGKFQEWE